VTVIAESHPLFPAADEDEDPPRVVSIHVQRNGETFPAKFAPEQLTDLEQLAASWGGGRYTLIARDERRITAQATYVIPGKSKPFIPEGDLEASVPAAPIIPHGGSDAMAILTFVSQQQAQSMQMMLQMSQHQSEMMMAMMKQQSDAQLSHQRELAQMHERASARDAQMFAAVLGRANQGDPQDLFLRGVETARGLLSSGEEGEGETAELVSSIVQGIGAFTGGGQQTQQPAQAAATGEPE
jgi:hypothetical protein